MFRLGFLPLNYLFELGFFLIAGILYLARLWHLRLFGPSKIAAITLVFTSVLICTFLMSGVIDNNDLGWRGFLPAQFMLLIWAVELLRFREEKWPGASRLYRIPSPALPALLVIGVVSTVYSALVLRAAEMLIDGRAEHATGKRNFAARRVYEQLRRILPVTAVVQQNPALLNPVYWGLYANRQTAVQGPGCGVVFGGTGRDCDHLYAALAAIFDSGAQADQVEPICGRLHIDVLVVTSGDPVWSVQDSWVWKRNALVSTESARAFLITPASLAERPVKANDPVR